MKTILLNNWKIKLTSLILAFALWFLIKENVSRNPVRPEFLKPSAPEAANPVKKISK